MRREVSVSIFAVLIVAAAVLTVYYLNVGPTGFVIVSQNDAASFGEGNYENTLWDGTAVVLNSSASNDSGNYVSEVFDAGSSATWNNLTGNWTGVTFEVRACTTADCSDANFNSTANLDNLSLTGQYFQYRTTFNSVNDSLESVAIDYTVPEPEPIVSVSVSQPNTEYTSLTGIPLVFTITQTTGTNLTCLYNINYAGGTLVSNTSISCASGANTKTFNLASKGGDNTLTLYVSDSSGSASASSGFSVSVPSGGITGGTVSEEEGEETPAEIEPVQVLVGEVPSQEMDLGTSRQLSISVQNTRTLPATSCILGGDDSGWVTFTDTAKDVNPGESVTLSFSVNVPSDATPGEHTLNLAVDCAETQVPRQLTVNVLEKKLDLDITNVERTREDRVTVDYSLIELAGEAQDVEVSFTITDASGSAVASTSQNSSVDANETDDFRVNIPINETLEGNLTLLAAFNSQIYSSSVLEPITLGAVTGGAIFGGVGTGGFLIVLIVAVVLIAVFFAARRMRQSGKTLKDLFSH